MRATVRSYEEYTDSYFVAVDSSGGRLRQLHAQDLAPIAVSDPVARSELQELGVFTAPAPQDRGGARDAAILLGAGSPPPLGGAQGDDVDEDGDDVDEDVIGTDSEGESDEEPIVDGEDAGHGDGGALHVGDDVDEDSDDIDEDVIGTDSEGESDGEPNVDGVQPGGQHYGGQYHGAGDGGIASNFAGTDDPVHPIKLDAQRASPSVPQELLDGGAPIDATLFLKCLAEGTMSGEDAQLALRRRYERTGRGYVSVTVDE